MLHTILILYTPSTSQTKMSKGGKESTNNDQCTYASTPIEVSVEQVRIINTCIATVHCIVSVDIYTVITCSGPINYTLIS